MTPLVALTGYILAIVLGAYCLVCLMRAIPAYRAGHSGAFNRWAGWAAVSGILSIALASYARTIMGG